MHEAWIGITAIVPNVVSFTSCGVGLDSWILPIDLSILDESGIKQPLLLVNSFDWQWKRNIQRMMKLTSSSPQCAIVTIR